MAVTVEIDSIETEDGAPASAPFKISDKPGKSKLTFSFSVVADGVLRAWRARFNPADHNSGRVLDSRGMVCGSGDRCGSPFAFSLDGGLSLEHDVEVTEPELHDEADGDYPVQVFAMQAGEWSS